MRGFCSYRFSTVAFDALILCLRSLNELDTSFEFSIFSFTAHPARKSQIREISLLLVCAFGPQEIGHHDAQLDNIPTTILSHDTKQGSGSPHIPH